MNALPYTVIRITELKSTAFESAQFFSTTEPGVVYIKWPDGRWYPIEYHCLDCMQDAIIQSDAELEANCKYEALAIGNP